MVEVQDDDAEDAVTTELNEMEREMEKEIERELEKFNEETYPTGAAMLGGGAASAKPGLATAEQPAAETEPDPAGDDGEPKIDGKTVASWL